MLLKLLPFGKEIDMTHLIERFGPAAAAASLDAAQGTLWSASTRRVL